MSELAVHPVAALFPMLADDELEELADDIKERGLLQPIVLDAEAAFSMGATGLLRARSRALSRISSRMPTAIQMATHSR